MCQESASETENKNSVDSHLDLNDFIGNAINDLCTKHDWMITRVEAIFNLMGECENIDEAKLVYELLDKFCYIHEEERNIGYEGMAKFITDSAKLAGGNILLLAMTKDKDPDSGQKILQDLRTFLIECDMPKHKCVNQMLSISSKKYPDVSTVFVVDEFVGSGKTVKDRAKFIQERLPNVGKVFFCVLAGMKSSIQSLHSEKIDIYCHYQLNKGITEEYAPEIVRSKIHTMFSLEGHLKRIVGTCNIKKYSFGYGRAQSLIALGRYNIPNSVFPLFWWPEHSSNGKRKRLFIRDEDGLN